MFGDSATPFGNGRSFLSGCCASPGGDDATPSRCAVPFGGGCASRGDLLAESGGSSTLCDGETAFGEGATLSVDTAPGGDCCASLGD